MIDTFNILLIVWLHFVGDFILQNSWTDFYKDKKNLALLTHTGAYSILFFFISAKYAVVNGILHGITDWITSRISSKLWEKDNKHWFFVVIGLDQAIHITTLILTLFLI